jgi:hypothetical protein
MGGALEWQEDGGENQLSRLAEERHGRVEKKIAYFLKLCELLTLLNNQRVCHFMNLSQSLSILCGALLVSAGSCFAQFGYVSQTPAAGAAPASVDPYLAGGGANYAPQGYASNGYGGTFGAPSAASASGGILSYGQLEANYKHLTYTDKQMQSSNGVGLSLMAQLFQPFFLHGSFDWSSGDSVGPSKKGTFLKNYSFSTVTIGGGGYFQITPQIHMVAEVGGLYSNLSATSSSLSFSNGAIFVNPHLRFAATPDLELDLGVMMTSADKYNARIFQVGGYYRMFSAMDLGLGADFGDQQDTYHLGVRFRW